MEKIRHHDTSRGHAMELKLTIVPMRRNHAESKREIVSGSGGGGGGGQLKPRSFVVRDIDYPRYFDENADGLAPRNKIQKRTFDMFGMSQPFFDNYRIPLHYNYQSKYADNLNTGEYYVSGDIGSQTTDRAFYQHPLPTIQYQSPSGFHEQQQLQRPHSIRFPTASAGSTNDYVDTVGTASPFTSTHLHHHFYLNKNNVPIVKATAFEKENLIEEHSSKGEHIINHQVEPVLQQNYSVDGFEGGPLSTAGYPHLSPLYKNNYPPSEHNIQHETHQSYQTPLAHTKTHQPDPALQQNYSVDGYDGGIISTAGYPPISTVYKNSYTPSDHHIKHETHQSYQTPFAHSDPVAVSPPSLYQHHQQYPAYVQPQLQLASPPHQQFYQPQQDISLTTAQYAPFQQHQLFPPIIDVHPRLNQIPLISKVHPIPFQGNFKYEDDRFSDPDPMYHQQITTVTQHFNPHILSHLLPAYADPHHLFGQRLNINYGQSSGTPGPRKPQAPPPHQQPEQPMQVPPSPTEVTPTEEEPTGKDNAADMQPQSPTGQEETIVQVDVPEPSGGDSPTAGGDSPTAGGDSPPTGADSPPADGDSPPTDVDSPRTAGEVEQSDGNIEPTSNNMEPINPIDEITEMKIENSSPPIEPSNDYGNMEQIDPNSKEVTSNFPDSINAQLPPPEQGEDLTVPYVDSSSIVPNLKSTPEKFQILVPSNNNHRTPLKPPYKTKASSTILQPVQTAPDKVKRNRQRGYLPTKATTEKPILKWMPKRSKPTKPHRTESVISTVLTASTTVKPNVVIVTPTHDIVEEPRTSKSTSISFSSSASNMKPKLRRVQPKYIGFLPTVLPSSGVSLTQGNVTTINTNSSELKLFRASDEDDGASNSGVDQQIARSIIKHAQNL